MTKALRIFAILQFGPLRHEIEIDGPKPLIEMVVPRYDFTAHGFKNSKPFDYIRMTFARQDTGHEVEDKVYINYRLWNLREEM